MFLHKHDVKKLKEITIDDETAKLIEYFMRTEKLDDINNTIIQLIKKGYSYWLLERKYGKNLEEHKVWSKEYWNLKTSSGFVYYRLRLKDAIDEIKRLAITMSSLLADLEDCYKRSGYTKKDYFVEKLRKYRITIEDYLNRFIFDLKKDIEQTSKNYVENEEEFIEWVEENLQRYKEEFLRKKKITS